MCVLMFLRLLLAGCWQLVVGWQFAGGGWFLPRGWCYCFGPRAIRPFLFVNECAACVDFHVRFPRCLANGFSDVCFLFLMDIPSFEELRLPLNRLPLTSGSLNDPVPLKSGLG